MALAQAAGYLAESGLAIGAYLEVFREHRADLLRRGDPPDDYTLTVFATLDLAMRRIAAPEAEDLLGLIACLAPDAIPRTLLEQAFDLDGAREGSPPRQLRLADALAALGRYSLIKARPQLIEAHRLVQAVAWDRMTSEMQARHAERAVTLLEAEFPQQSEDVRTWDACKALQPHADHAAWLAERCRMAPAMVGALLDRVGIFDMVRARFRDAEARYRRAMTIKEASYGPDHPDVALTLTNLGIVARLQGELAEARRCLERALRIEEASYGPDHPEVAITLGNLGIVLVKDGEPARAKPLVERALGIFRKSLGDEHPHTLWACEYLREIEERSRGQSEEGVSQGKAPNSDSGSGPEPA